MLFNSNYKFPAVVAISFCIFGGTSPVLAEYNAGGCPQDLTGPAGVPDGVVDTLDLLNIFANWGPCPGCPQDLTGPAGVPDGVVDTLDLLNIFANWGPC